MKIDFIANTDFCINSGEISGNLTVTLPNHFTSVKIQASETSYARIALCPECVPSYINLLGVVRSISLIQHGSHF